MICGWIKWATSAWRTTTEVRSSLPRADTASTPFQSKRSRPHSRSSSWSWRTTWRTWKLECLVWRHNSEKRFNSSGSPVLVPRSLCLTFLDQRHQTRKKTTSSLEGWEDHQVTFISVPDYWEHRGYAGHTGWMRQHCGFQDPAAVFTGITCHRCRHCWSGGCNSDWCDCTNYSEVKQKLGAPFVHILLFNCTLIEIFIPKLRFFSSLDGRVYSSREKHDAPVRSGMLSH